MLAFFGGTMTDFGFDTSCTTALRTGRFSSGPRLVAEACFRRLSTLRGTLRGERRRGRTTVSTSPI